MVALLLWLLPLDLLFLFCCSSSWFDSAVCSIVPLYIPSHPFRCRRIVLCFVVHYFCLVLFNLSFALYVIRFYESEFRHPVLITMFICISINWLSFVGNSYASTISKWDFPLRREVDGSVGGRVLIRACVCVQHCNRHKLDNKMPTVAYGTRQDKWDGIHLLNFCSSILCPSYPPHPLPLTV